MKVNNQNFKELNKFFDFLTNNNEELKKDLIDSIKFKLTKNIGDTFLYDISNSYPNINGSIVFPSHTKKYDIINLVSNDEKLKKVFFNLIKVINKFKENYNSIIIIEDDGRFLVSNDKTVDFLEKRKELVKKITNLTVNNPLGLLVFINRKKYTLVKFFREENTNLKTLTLDHIEKFDFNDNFIKELLNEEKIENFIEN